MKNIKARLIVRCENDKVLVLCKHDGSYSLIGGGVKSNETPKQGLMREIKEETGINIDESSLVELKKIVKSKKQRHYFEILSDKKIDFKVMETDKFSSIKCVNIFKHKKKIKKTDFKILKSIIKNWQ